MSVPTETRCNVCGRPATPADRYCGFCGSRLDGDNATPTAENTGPHRPHVDRILSALRAATMGEYDIAGEIGRGGMAVVFLAHDLSLNRKVAIKVLLPELLYTEGMDRRFKHEARIAAKLDHPNILVIHGVREANDLLFIVMKLVDGLPLSAIAKVAGPLSVPVVRLIVRSVADALSYAHGEGVVHRDVKPANIMVDRRGNVVVMDFGIAKAADDAHLTRTGLVIGTPAYMSPEQCLAQGVSPASDQYSLGVVAYELLTGKTPFRGSALEMQWSHATAAPPSVRSLRPDCSADLDAIVLRMMAKSPEDRWPTLHDVSHALADDPATASGARSALIALVSEVPGRRDATMPTTPASPVPIGPGPAVLGDATTDPVRGTGGQSVASAPVATTPDGGAAATPMLTLSQQRIELSTGDTVELVVELDSDDQPTDGSAVEWQTSDPAVATVSRDGLVTAVGPGLAEVTCIWRGRRAVCLVQVSAASAATQPSPPAHRDPSTTTAGSVIALGAPPARAPAAPVPVRSMRRYWWIGVLTAGVASVALFRALRPDEFVTALPKDVATSPATPAAPTPPPTRGGAGRSPTSAGGGSERAAARGAAPAPPRTAATGSGTGRMVPNTTTPAQADPRAVPATRQAIVSSPSSVPPVVPPARLDSARLTTRVDTGTGYSASRSATNPAPPTAAPAARDSAADVIPAAPREIASALFKEFANAINGRAYSRITSAFPQPSDAAAAKVWADFLVFVRDYTPRATVRSSVVNETSTPPTITATIDFRWSSDAGFDRVRSGSFVGIGVPIPGGWQLRGVKLAKKFW